MKIRCIIPAYNEETTFGNVLDVLTKARVLDEIRIVDDGSTDNTLSIAKKYREANKKKIRIVNLPVNKGKGQAVRIAAEGIEDGIVFLCDADLVGLREKHIRHLLAPLYEGCDMTVGERDEPSPLGKFFLLGGERMIFATPFREILKNRLADYYGLEMVMNNYCKQRKMKIKKVKLENLTHISKPQKWENGKKHLLDEVYKLVKIKTVLEKKNIAGLFRDRFLRS